ncbi:hypothetical protein [Methylocystis sp.]|jgi:hypothetical protein|uniref:hypothetical protein n=1 Tax=Methylocystis sp. TaxID=1911079 RepID=UPI0027358B99|nr:hypothetical protein [Methylocystis sp.]MDP3554850.1 hypothetical protein [Methylocystis sp.]
MAEDCPIGKIGYDNRAQARRVAREVNGRKGGLPNDEYRCAHCGKWHIGRKSKASLSPQRWRKIQQSWGVGGHSL